MAEEMLRRNLERAFDPGPDFPDRLLLSRTMAMLRSGAGVGVEKHADRRPSWRWFGVRLAAVVLAVIVFVGATLGFLALHRFVAPVPVHTPHFRVQGPGVAVCSRNCFLYPSPQFVSAKVGWLTETDGNSPAPTTVVFRTDDGARHWKAQLSWNHHVEKIVASPDGRDVLIISPDAGAPLMRSVDGGASWTSHALPQGAANFTWPTPVVHFLSPSEGWVLFQEQSHGIADLFHTTNSGAHWMLTSRVDLKAQFNLANGGINVYGQADQLGQLLFQSSSVGWFIPNSGVTSSTPDLFRTLDGGITWIRQSLPESRPIKPGESTSSTVRFFNDREGLVDFSVNQSAPSPTSGVGSGYIYSTSDGGDHWSGPTQLPPEVFWTVRIDFIDLNHWAGWVVPDGWMSTADAGRHWKTVSAHAPTPVPGTGAPAVLTRSWFHFFDQSQGLVLLGIAPAGGGSVGVALYVTSDGGVNWTPLNLPELSSP